MCLSLLPNTNSPQVKQIYSWYVTNCLLNSPVNMDIPVSGFHTWSFLHLEKSLMLPCNEFLWSSRHWARIFIDMISNFQNNFLSLSFYKGKNKSLTTKEFVLDDTTTRMCLPGVPAHRSRDPSVFHSVFPMPFLSSVWISTEDSKSSWNHDFFI